MLTIEAKGLYYKALNRQIRESLARGEKEIVLRNILGQRYIGGGLNGDALFRVYGTPGQDLGAFMNGPAIIVYGNAQDGVGNTMNAGKIIVHGKAGEIPAHSMRGGRIFIRGDVEYRAAIHMKEYMTRIPWLVVGGTAKDYCGEYMAGGRVVVLNLGDVKQSPVGYAVGTGIHGGAIYVRGNVNAYQLGTGAVFSDLDDDDAAFLAGMLREYAEDLGVNLAGIVPAEFVKITRRGHRPFGSLYTPAVSVKAKKPLHVNLTPPCASRCPTGIPTPVFFNLIKAGHVREAQRLMDEYTPFRLSVCGTVCPALCMEACSRNALDGAVNIRELAQKYYPAENPEPAKEARREVISVMGAGPAGISAAWQLSRRGYRVHLYDAAGDIGGKVRMAIPKERLPEDVLVRDVKRIRSLPIVFSMGVRVDRKKFDEIARASDIVVVATGAHVTKRIPYPGGGRILSGLKFLVDIGEGRPMDCSGKEVVIIGAGNVGMDIACEAWRLGAAKVTAVDIQKPLAFGRERDLALEKGTEILWPRMIERLDDTTVYFKDGETLIADVVFFSIGESPDTSFLPESVLVSERGFLVTGGKSFRTGDPKIFGCGDIVQPGLVTDAIGSGRLAAMEIHAVLSGEEFLYPEKNEVPKRSIIPLYFGPESSEVDRCISCGTCIFCDTCVERCPQKALSRNGEIFTIDTERCTLCYTCVGVCPRGAIQIESASPE